MRKILYIDSETGGTNPEKSALIQLSGIIEIDGIEKEKFNFYVKPFENSEVNEEALQVQNRTFEELKDDKYVNEKEVYTDFVSILDKYVNKYDKNDKFLVSGFNVNFDVNMLKAFFVRNHNPFLFSYIESPTFALDPMLIITFLQMANIIPKLENNKLGTLCKYFNIDFQAHDSLEDIVATKKLIKKIVSILETCKK